MCRKGPALLLIAAVLTALPAPGETVRLADGSMSATLVVDDAGSDTVASRFDRSARVTSVTVDGKSFLQAPGLIDEFGILGDGVLGFDAAGPDGRFIKIGVGVLGRDGTAYYSFRHDYPVHRAAKTRVVDQSPNTIHIRQDQPEIAGYAYRYEKIYTLDASQQSLTIPYCLTNRGSTAFSFEHYNHNWWQFGETELGASIIFKTGFDPPPLPFPWLYKEGGVLRHRAQRPKRFYLRFFDPIPAEDAFFVMRDIQTDRAIKLSASRAVSRFALYLTDTAACPELFTQFELAPEETATWTMRYVFDSAVAPREEDS